MFYFGQPNKTNNPNIIPICTPPLKYKVTFSTCGSSEFFNSRDVIL